MEAKKYCFITFLFNDYDLLREPLELDSYADYYCITDNYQLKSNKWNIIYLKEFDNDLLTGIQKTYKCKYSFYKYIPNNYEYYFTLDASIQICKPLYSVIEYMEKNNCDIGLSMHPSSKSWEEEYKCWLNGRGLDIKYYNIFKQFISNNGFDVNEQYGLIECTVKIYKNTQKVLNFIDDVYDTLKSTNNFEDKNDQCYFTYVFNKYDKTLNSMFFYRQFYANSNYFKIFYHKTNIQWFANTNKYTNTNLLFGIKRNLLEFK